QFTYTYTAAAGGSVTASVSGTGIDSGSQFDSGSDIVLTITPESNYELTSLTVNGTERKEEVQAGSLTLTGMTGDVTVAAVFAQVTATYCVPTGTTNTDVYLSSITSTGSKDGTEINYSSSSQLPSNSPYVKLDQTLTVQRGSTFTINYVGAKSDQEKPQITCNHAEIFVDWNGDGVFEGETEVLPMIGKDAGMSSGIPTESGRNLDVKVINQTFTVPADAALGQSCVRIKYVDAWHIRGNNNEDPEHGPCAKIAKGCVYDIMLNITDVPKYAITLDEPVHGTFKVMNGDQEVLSGTEVSEGTVLTIVPEPASNYALGAIKVNGNSIEGTSFTVSGSTTITVEFTEIVPDKYLYTYEAVTGGNITAAIGETPLLSNTQFDGGSEIILTIVPETGYELTSLLINTEEKKDEVSDGMLTLPLQSENLTVVAAFAKQQFSVTFDQPANGTITVMAGETPVSSGSTVEYGTEITITATAIDGYEVSTFTVNGENKLGELPYTQSVTTAITIVSECSEIPPVVSSSAIRIPAKNGNNHYMFRFDDQLLGNHTGGSSNNDQRIRTFTMSAWVNPSTTEGDVMGLVQSKFYVDSGSFGIRLRNGKIHLFSRCVTLPDGFGDDINVETTATLPIGEWAFITTVIDNENKTITLYKNGEVVTTQTFNRDGFGMLYDISCFFVGCMDFAGDIEGVQLWSKALTQQQVRASQAGYDQAPADLLYYYKFNSADVNMTQFPNKGNGGECIAELAYGSSKYEYDADLGYSVMKYSYTAQVPEYVQGHVKAQHTVTYNGTVTGGSFEVKNGDEVVASGSSLDEGTWLTIETTPETGYLVKTIKVNGNPIEGDGFNLSEPSEITVEFTNKLVYTYTKSEGGSISASIGGEPLANEGEFDRGSEVLLTIASDDHYELTSLMVGSEEKVTSVQNNTLTLSDVQDNLTVIAVF
ncbi:InlB B-repeat-containing protein, partial [Coprobacter sp.]